LLLFAVTLPYSISWHFMFQISYPFSVACVVSTCASKSGSLCDIL